MLASAVTSVPARPQPTALGMQVSRRGGFGILNGEMGPRFWRQDPSSVRYPVLLAHEGAGPGPVSPPAPPSHLGPGSGFGRRPA